MARGKLLRTKIKNEKALVKARLQAEKEWYQRKANFQYLFKKELVNMMRRIDPLEFAAVGGLTMVIKSVIDETEEIRGRIRAIAVIGELPEGMKAVWSGIPFWYVLVPEGETFEGMFPEWVDWLFAFGIAYVLVRHPEVVTEMFTGATKLTTFVLGLLS